MAFSCHGIARRSIVSVEQLNLHAASLAESQTVTLIRLVVWPFWRDDPFLESVSVRPLAEPVL